MKLHYLLALCIAMSLVLSVQPARAQVVAVSSGWARLTLVSQKRSKTQLVCRYARTGETRRLALKQEAMAIFRLPNTGKGRAVNCPRPSPGRTNLVTFTNNLRRHPILGKLLMRLTMSPIHN